MQTTNKQKNKALLKRKYVWIGGFSVCILDIDQVSYFESIFDVDVPFFSFLLLFVIIKV